MSELSLSEQAEVAQAGAEFERLRLLDQVWTGQLNSYEAVSGEVPEQLLSLGEELDQSVARYAEHSTKLSGMFEAHPELVVQVYEEFIRSDKLDDSTREWWGLAAVAPGGVPAAVARAAQHFVKISRQERADIAAKLERLRRGEPTSGDLSEEGTCAAAIAATIGLGILAVATGGFASPAFVYAVLGAAGSGAYCGRYRVLGKYAPWEP